MSTVVVSWEKRRITKKTRTLYVILLQNVYIKSIFQLSEKSDFLKSLFPLFFKIRKNRKKHTTRLYHHHVARIISQVWLYGSQLKTTLIHLRHPLKIFIKTVKMKTFVTNYNFQRNQNCHLPNINDSLIQFVS